VIGCCEHGNKPSGSIKGGKLLDWFSEYYLLKRTLLCGFNYLVRTAVGICEF